MWILKHRRRGHSVQATPPKYKTYREMPIHRNERMNHLCKYELLYRIGNPEAARIHNVCDISFATPRMHNPERMTWKFQWGLFRYYPTDRPEVLLVGIDRVPTYEELDHIQGKTKRRGHSDFQVLVMFRASKVELNGLRTLDYYYGENVKPGSVYDKWKYYIPGINCPLETETQTAEQYDSKIQNLLEEGYFTEEVPVPQTLSTSLLRS